MNIIYIHIHIYIISRRFTNTSIMFPTLSVVLLFPIYTFQTCHSLRPHFDKTASTNPNVIFVEVPVLEHNANLHKGLGVESVPFVHIYHPRNGLVEETKLSRKTFSEFEDMVTMHSSSLQMLISIYYWIYIFGWYIFFEEGDLQIVLGLCIGITMNIQIKMIRRLCLRNESINVLYL